MAQKFLNGILSVDGSSSSPSYSFIGRTDTGMYARAHSSNDRIAFAVDGNERFYIDANGVNAIGNVYLSSGNSVRNYSGIWQATTGATENGFVFTNTADSQVMFEAQHDYIRHTSDGAAADGATLYLKHANNNSTDTIGTIFFGNNADTTLSKIVAETNGANNTSNLKFGTSNTGTMATVLTLSGDNIATFSGGPTYHKIQTYYDGDYTSGFKFSDYNGGIWYDAGADDLTLNAGHANSQMLLNSGGAIALTLDSSQNATFAGNVGIGNLGTYKLEVSEDGGDSGTADLLLLRNSNSTRAQTFQFQLDTAKDLVITGSSGSGGFKFVPGSRGTTFTGSLTAGSFIKSGGTSAQYLMANGSVTTGVASHNHDSRYTSIDASGDNYTFEIEDEGNFSGNKWYHIANINSHNGGLHIRGAILNHVENFASQKLDIAIQVREAGSGSNVEINGTVDVHHNDAATNSANKAGVRVIQTSTGNTSYQDYKVYVRTTQYSQLTLRLTQQGSVTFNTNHTSPLTSEPAPVSGGSMELDTSALLEGHHVVVDSTVKLTVATDAATFAGTIKALDGSATTPAYNFTSHDGNGMYLEDYDATNNKEQVSWATDGTRRAWVNEPGLWTANNLYFAGQLRKFGEWHATSGTAGEGFKFENTADSTTPLTLTSAGNATFAGTLRVNGSNVGIGGAAANASHGSVGTKLDIKGGADSIIILRGAAGGSGADAYVASEYGLYSYDGEFTITRTNQSSWWTSPDFKLSGGNATFARHVTAAEYNLPSGGMLDWANGDARIVEGETNNYSLSFKTWDGTNVSTALRLDGNNAATFAGKINALGGASISGFTAATINAYSTTVSANLFSALRIIDNTGASSYWDIGAIGGASTLLNFYHNANTTPKISFTHTGGANFAGSINVNTNGLIKYEQNTDVDSSAAEAVASVVHGTHTAAFFDYVIKKGTNVRAGIVTACHDGTNVEYAETSTVDLGDTSDVTLSIDISGIYMRL